MHMDFGKLVLFELLHTCLGGLLRRQAIAKVAEINERRQAESIIPGPGDDHHASDPKFGFGRSRIPDAKGR
jgi:hypothetical protein